MNIKCPNCGGSITYDTTTQKMTCEFCKSEFDANTLSASPENEEYMEMNIYSCSSCGAELAMNEYETSSYCIYCGQPTIAFSRISKELKPKYISPFKINKQQAIANIRNQLTNGFFVPKEIKNFKEECVRGIYIPYWLFDVDYSSGLIISNKAGNGKNDKTEYFYGEAKTHFNAIPIDASLRINDEVSQRLEPFPISELKIFHPSYLSGFYSDRYDVPFQQVENEAMSRSTTIFMEELRANLSKQHVENYKAQPKINITGCHYAMLPAWFCTFNYKNEPYTFLVNGVTGKTVGAVPYIRSRTIAITAILGLILSIPSILIINSLFANAEDPLEYGWIVFLLIILFITAGTFWFKSIKESIDFSKSRIMFNFVRNRQGGLK